MEATSNSNSNSIKKEAMTKNHGLSSMSPVKRNVETGEPPSKKRRQKQTFSATNIPNATNMLLSQQQQQQPQQQPQQQQQYRGSQIPPTTITQQSNQHSHIPPSQLPASEQQIPKKMKTGLKIKIPAKVKCKHIQNHTLLYPILFMFCVCVCVCL